MLQLGHTAKERYLPCAGSGAPDKESSNIKARVDQAILCYRPKLDIRPPEERAKDRFCPDEGTKERSTRMVSNHNVLGWVCNESEEGSELVYYANQWVQAS